MSPLLLSSMHAHYQWYNHWMAVMLHRHESITQSTSHNPMCGDQPNVPLSPVTTIHRTVSYCPPAYYAHHAAFRARCLLRKEPLPPAGPAAAGDSGSETSASGAGTTTGSTTSSGAYQWVFHEVHRNLRDQMYFV